MLKQSVWVGCWVYKLQCSVPLTNWKVNEYKHVDSLVPLWCAHHTSGARYFPLVSYHAFFLFGFSSKFVILSFDIFNNICKLMACRCCICSLKLMLSLCHYPSGVDRGDAARYWWTTADYWETSGDYWETTPDYSGKRKDIWYCLCLS